MKKSTLSITEKGANLFNDESETRQIQNSG